LQLHHLQKKQKVKAFSPSKAKSKASCPKTEFFKASENQKLAKWVFLNEKIKSHGYIKFFQIKGGSFVSTSEGKQVHFNF